MTAIEALRNTAGQVTAAGLGLPVVTVEKLRVVLAGGDAAVVEDVSLDIRPREILGLVGESGSGKTTLGLAMLGYSRRGLAFGAGSVRIDGTDILAQSDAAKRDSRRRLVSYVPQDPATALNPTLRLRTQLSECFPNPAEATEARLLQMLAEVKLPADGAFLQRFPHQLSGGQQQRIAIAMAFAHRPRLIVMDEPTTGLDVTTQAHVLDTVRQLCREHDVAVVYVSHDLAVVDSLADRVAVLYAGHIVEIGPVRRVLQQPEHPYTRALIRAVPDLEGRAVIQGISGQAPDPRHRPAGCAFAPRCDLATEDCRRDTIAAHEIGKGHFVQCLFAGTPDKAAATALDRPAQTGTSSAVPVLRVDGLNASHGDRQILWDISLQVPSHCCLALVGESGSGKTTLARCIAGLHRNLTGSLSLEGVPLPVGSRNRTRELRQRIQYIFQNPYASLNPRRTIGRSLEVALLEFERPQRQQRRGRIIAALESVALPARFADLYPHEMSGGQRQRAAIARALIVEPTLLVCDEVTSALDVSVQAVVVDVLRKLQEERGLAMLFVTHNLALVRNIAQRVAVLQAGRIVEEGDVAAVLGQPQSAETRRLMQDAPHFDLGNPPTQQANEAGGVDPSVAMRASVG
ncbi:MAG TPA: ABC transporter ATP-binding protein [Dongiaceae bacterium]|nr:ABC transporter ATP-binding protein [Dongiaceae bacterium]